MRVIIFALLLIVCQAYAQQLNSGVYTRRTIDCTNPPSCVIACSGEFTVTRAGNSFEAIPKETTSGSCECPNVMGSVSGTTLTISSPTGSGTVTGNNAFSIKIGTGNSFCTATYTSGQSSSSEMVSMYKVSAQVLAIVIALMLFL